MYQITIALKIKLFL